MAKIATKKGKEDNNNVEEVVLGNDTYRGFKAVGERQFFARQVGVIAMNGKLRIKTGSLKEISACVCCFNESRDLEVLVCEGRIWQSQENSRILLVRNGSISITGERNYFSPASPLEEALPISDPEKICLKGNSYSKTGTVLVFGEDFLVLLGDKPGDLILAMFEGAKCVNTLI